MIFKSKPDKALLERIEALEARVRELEQDNIIRVGEWKTWMLHHDPRPTVTTREAVEKLIDASGLTWQHVKKFECVYLAKEEKEE